MEVIKQTKQQVYVWAAEEPFRSALTSGVINTTPGLCPVPCLIGQILSGRELVLMLGDMRHSEDCFPNARLPLDPNVYMRK